MNLTACKRLALQPINAIWYRAISAEHWETALRTDQTLVAPTRFNPGVAARTPFEVLYLAENQLVALFEVGAIVGPPDQPIAHPSRRKTTPFDVSVRLQSVVDLTDPTQQALLETSAQEPTGIWKLYSPGEAPTQRLGATLFATRNVEGFLAISTKMHRCKTLMIFPKKPGRGRRAPPRRTHGRHQSMSRVWVVTLHPDVSRNSMVSVHRRTWVPGRASASCGTKTMCCRGVWPGRTGVRTEGARMPPGVG
jgi:RES domain